MDILIYLRISKKYYRIIYIYIIRTYIYDIIYIYIYTNRKFLPIKYFKFLIINVDISKICIRNQFNLKYITKKKFE